MAIVRRRKSDYDQSPLRISAQSEQQRLMKYSQTINQSPANWVTSPIRNPDKISFVVSPTKNKQYLQGIQQVIPAAVRSSEVQDAAGQRVSSRQSPEEITFKRLTNNPFRQSLQANNTSIANVSANTSESNTQRLMVRAANSEGEGAS